MAASTLTCMEFNITVTELPVRLRSVRSLTDDELLKFCSLNHGLRVEREATGELTILSPTGSEAGYAEVRVASQLLAWADRDGKGRAFGPNAGFRLRDGSMRAADACWVSWASWNALRKDEQRGFAPVCPQFVIELRSPTDRLPDLQTKMREWIANGVELGWMIDPERQVVEVYRPDLTAPSVLEGVTSAYGDGSIAGFILELAPIWDLA